MRTTLCLLLLSGLLSGPLRAQDLVIRGARIITGKGGSPQRGNILVKDGRIAKIGSIGKVDDLIPVIQAAGRFVVPAFVLAHTSSGMRRPNESMGLSPFVSVMDAINPVDGFFEDCLRDGHLTVLVIPGNNTVIGGMGMVVHPFGMTVEHMTVVKEAGLKISLIPPTKNRAAHMARLRGALDRARDKLLKLEREGRVRVRVFDLALGMEAEPVFERVVEGNSMYDGIVPALAFSPDGKWLAGGHANNKLLLWNLAAGGGRKEFLNFPSTVRSVAFHPGGELVAAGSSRPASLRLFPGFRSLIRCRPQYGSLQASASYRGRGRSLP